MPAMYRGKEQIPGKTVVITGCNTGIGKETAKDMARRGARVIMACRNLESAEAAKREIVDETGSDKVVVKKLDLASFASIRAFCEDVNATESKIDILINNAGIGGIPKLKTEDGYEMQMGVNQFGHFLMTNLLLNKVKAAAPSRIVILGSEAHRFFSTIDFDDNKYSDKGYQSISKYSQAKLACHLFALELSKRLKDSGVNVYIVQPGSVDSDLARHSWIGSACCRCFCFPCRRFLMKTTEEGAQTTIYCALAPGIANESGRYYDNCRERQPHARALNENDARRLWEISEEVTGVTFGGGAAESFNSRM